MTGHYYLKSVRETGSELWLKADGSFEWTFTYGASDRFVRGRWTYAKNRLTLDADVASTHLDFRLFAEDELRIRKPASPGTWIAIVGVPRRGPLAGVEVAFEATSGTRQIAISDENGDAQVRMPTAERWRRAGLRRQGDTQDFQWFDVPAERAIERIAGFAPLDPAALERPAFKQMVLTSRGKELVSEDGRLVYAK